MDQLFPSNIPSSGVPAVSRLFVLPLIVIRALLSNSFQFFRVYAVKNVLDYVIYIYAYVRRIHRDTPRRHKVTRHISTRFNHVRQQRRGS